MLERSPLQTSRSALVKVDRFGRRVFFAIAFACTIVLSLAWAALALSPGGLGLLDIALLVLFAITLPWTVAGFWNAVIGFCVMRFSKDRVAAVIPEVTLVSGFEPVTVSTAILICIRNELPDRMVRNLEPMLAGLDAAGCGDRFHLYVLSDTNDAAIADAEERAFADLNAAWTGRVGITYRRRTDNAGFKAGNIRDFGERWGHLHELAVTLDVDSLMSAEAVLRLVRVMQANPALGILQGLVVALPSTSLFARVFQFGMRLGMRSYTIGSAWWQGDCGPYWGHNAVLRLKPFMASCHLPVLAGRDGKPKHILSHDQIEAVLMRRAGYEVRVLPEEDLGWEENPPTLIEFARRDLRWCQGNMQYWPFLTLPGLKPTSRYQLGLAIQMFMGSPAWIGLLVLGTLAAATAARPSDFIRADLGMPLLGFTLLMWFAPKIASALDVLLMPEGRRSFGGTLLFLVNFVLETVYSVLLVPILWFGHTMFLVGLLFGREIGWIGQTREDHEVPWSLALSNFWPHTLLGCLCVGLLAATQPAAIPYALLLAGGLVCAVPMAVLTARPDLGRLAARIGIGRLPEEVERPALLQSLDLPALRAISAPARD